MKKTLGLVFLFIFFNGFLHGQTKDTLYKLYKAKQFMLLDKNNTDRKHSLYFFYKAVYASVANQPASSNKYLDSFMINKANPPKQIGFGYWKLRNDNDVKLFDYKNALTTQELVIKDYKNAYNSEEYTEETYTAEIWRALNKEPPQTIRRSGSSIIPFTRDLAGLINIKVNANGTDTNFVFDTGAGMSSVTESLAKKLNFRILASNEIKVSGFNAVLNPVQIAVVDELKIGDIIIFHEPFLVFKDSALSFAGGAYKINGIIGFPVAKELGSLTITSGYLRANDLSEEDSSTEKNLFVELLHSIIFLKYKEKLLPFNFDTGANSSQFTKLFYDEYGGELKKTGRFETQGNAGAGGTRKYKALMVDNIKLMLGNQEINFPEIEIDTENYHTSGKELYGNIGQDLLKQYKKVTINFKMNYLKLEN